MTTILGYAAHDNEYEAHINAYWKIARISDAILEKIREYGRETVHLDPKKTKHLNDLEKFILANGWTSKYGGEVNGDTVTIYTVYQND